MVLLLVCEWMDDTLICIIPKMTRYSHSFFLPWMKKYTFFWLNFIVSFRGGVDHKMAWFNPYRNLTDTLKIEHSRNIEFLTLRQKYSLLIYVNYVRFWNQNETFSILIIWNMFSRFSVWVRFSTEISNILLSGLKCPGCSSMNVIPYQHKYHNLHSMQAAVSQW